MQARLLVILRDRAIQRTLVGCCSSLIRGDFSALITRLVTGQKRGVRVRPDVVCSLCSDPLQKLKETRDKEGRGTGRRASTAAGDGAGGSSGGADADGGSQTGSGGGGGGSTAPEPEPPPVPRVVIFFCAHCFHESCLRDLRTQGGGAGRESSRSRTASSFGGQHDLRRGSYSSVTSAGDGLGSSSSVFSRAAGTAIPASKGRGGEVQRSRRNSSATSVTGDNDPLAGLPFGTTRVTWRCPLCSGSREPFEGR
jgi:hypothetical protein